MSLKFIFDIIAGYKNDPDITMETLLTLEDLEKTIKEFIKESNRINGNN